MIMTSPNWLNCPEHRAGGWHRAGIDGEAFATAQSGQAALQHLLEHESQRVVIAESAVPVPRERRMVRHRVLQAQPTETVVGQVQMHLFAQPTL
jgi:hypothetical protein